jgi:hypothetical protein
LAEEAVTMSLAELIRQLPAADFSLETLQRTQALELLAIDGSEVTVPQPAFLEAGQALTAMSVPTSAILDSYEFLRLHVAAIATNFAKIYDDYVSYGRSAINRSSSEDTVKRATEQLEVLSQTAVKVVASELRRALRGIAAERLAELSR